ncbi:MAG: two-component regulator propeller domain-containing protein [Bryobacterales bacterium]|nr:two-component regulator propeller domain-containing protein [Bryobacterales bacterium]
MLLALSLLLLSPAGSATGERYSFRVYEHPDGLEDLVIRDLLQDRTGFLWIATHTGLYRFDGKTFRRYTTADGLADNYVTNLAEDARGTLWVATVRGLSRRTGHRFETILPEREELRFRPNTGTPLAVDGEGNVFVSTKEGVFAVWQNSSSQPESLAPPLRFQKLGEVASEANSVSGLLADRGNGIWFTGPGGALIRQSRSTGQRESPDPALPAETWVSILEDPKGGIWLASSSGKVFAREPNASRFRRIPMESSARGRLGQGRSGEILVPAASGFFVIKDYGREMEKIDAAVGLPGEVIECFLSDRDGMLWIGTVGTGLIRWMGGEDWRHWTAADGLPGDYITQIATDASGAKWVGTLRGLATLRQAARDTVRGSPGDPFKGKGAWAPERYPLPTSFGEAPPVYAVAAGRNDEIWLSLTPGYAHLLHSGSGRVERFGGNEGFDVGMVCQYLVHDGAVWIAGTGGLAVVRESGGKRRVERVWPKDDDATVYRVEADSMGRIWAATARGLLRVNPDGFRLYDKENGLQQSDIFGLSVATDDSIWIHYRLPLGVSQLRAGPSELRIRHFRESDGLASDKVFSIATDGKRRVWVGTEFGISVLAGAPPWTTFNRDHGLVWNDCTFGALAADSAGDLWIGTSKGLSLFHPPSGIERPPPPVAITALRSGRMIAAPAALAGRVHTKPDVSVSFAALRFSNQAAIRFRYRLEEASATKQAEWIPTRDREVNFARLSPGIHRFEVAASEGDGKWSELPATVEVSVPTPWWRQWWAIGFMIWTILATLRLVWRWRYKRMIHLQGQLESAVGERTRELEVQRERAEAASRFKDQILANVSHEIRTPLNGIVGFTGLVLETNLDDDQRDQLQTVHASGKSLVDIIEDLLDFASIEAGDLRIEERDVSIADVLDQMFRTLRYEADHRALAFRSICAEEIPAVLRGDGHRLRQVLLNLLGNAFKFTEAGTVELRAARADAPADLAGPADTASEQIWVCFEVADTGIGISPRHLDQIFEPFRQLDGTSRRIYGGAGLGLATVRRIVDSMGGRIDVESELGKGSVFRVTVPFRFPLAKPIESRTSPGLHNSSGEETPEIRRVLIAEDNPVNQRLLHRILAKRGLEVFTVADGRAATEAVQSENFDLILMDIQMPVMDGIEATRVIRERERVNGSRRLPIVAVTANGMFQCREECFAVGMDGYVVKPYGPANLFEAIDKVHRQIACHGPGSVEAAEEDRAAGGQRDPQIPA